MKINNAISTVGSLDVHSILGVELEYIGNHKVKAQVKACILYLSRRY